MIRRTGEVIFTSIDGGAVYSVPSVAGGPVSDFADVGGGPNGATEGVDGSIFITQTGGRWGENKAPDWDLKSGIQVVRPEGSIEWISTDPISPNDLCFGPDGWLYCTDPTRYRWPRDDGRIFRVNVETHECQLLCSVDWYPNGIGFGPDDDILYVADAYRGRIMAMPLDNIVEAEQQVFIQLDDDRTPDGFLFDVEGNLVTSAVSHNDGPGQIRTYDPAGRLLDVYVPGANKAYTNMALDSTKTLVVTDSRGGAVLVVDDWHTAGLPLHPFRTT